MRTLYKIELKDRLGIPLNAVLPARNTQSIFIQQIINDYGVESPYRFHVYLNEEQLIMVKLRLPAMLSLEEVKEHYGLL